MAEQTFKSKCIVIQISKQEDHFLATLRELDDQDGRTLTTLQEIVIPAPNPEQNPIKGKTT